MCRLWRYGTRTARLESTSNSKSTFSRCGLSPSSSELRRIGLLRCLLRLALLRVLLCAGARLPAAGAIVQARGLANFRILCLQCLQGFFCSLRAGRAAGCLDFATNFGHFCGDLLSHRRAVELQQSLDLVVGVVLVVNDDE